MPEHSRIDVAIVGAGASGVLLANALVRPPTPLNVVLIDPQPGRGVAYAPGDRRLTLNTRVGNMSLDAASPSGFQDWLELYHARPEGWSVDDFAPRALYGDYLERRLADEQGVLATGVARPRPLLFHGRDQIEAQVQDDPWDQEGLHVRTRGGEVLLVGTGLTALDVAEAVLQRDPKARVIAVSRHGLLPRVHASPAPSGPALTPPYPTTARELYAKLRAAAEFVEGDSAMRHGVFLGLRQIAGKLWAGLPEEERLMFLRHFRRYWDVERHRIPPAQAAYLRKAAAKGRFETVRGRLAEAKALPSGQAARVALLTSQGPRALTVSRIVNCTGPEPDPFRSRNPLLLDLLAQGEQAGRGPALRVQHGAVVVDTDPQAQRVGVGGALTQGQFFEITSVPEIRAQAIAVASQILANAAVQGHFTTGGMELRIESTLPPVFRPKVVPRS